MVLSCGHPPLVARSAKGTALPSQVHSRSRALSEYSARTGRLLGVLGPEPGRNRRYTRCQVLCFKTDSSLVKREASNADSLSHRPGVVRYRFVVPQYVTTFGQTLRVVGSLPELGEWNPQQAPTMTWSDGHQWSLDCALPQRSFEFKITVLEGHGVKWEGGSNRVVHAEDDDGDIPVEIVVWLTCNFNATTSTQMQLAVPRASIRDAYETGKATLEFLNRRKSKLGQDTEQASSFEERKRQAAELARLSEAVVEQSTVVHQLSDWLGHEAGPGRGAARKNGNGKQHAANGTATAADDDNETLLLAIDSVRVPRVLRRISFVQSWDAGPAALASTSGGADGNGTSAEARVPVPVRSPFLRGELDSLAEDLISAAEVLLQELKSPSDDTAAQASVELASLAVEAGQVAVAMEALGGGYTASGHATQLQLRGLASVGSALAGGGSSGSGAPDEPAADGVSATTAEEGTPVLQVLAAPSESEAGPGAGQFTAQLDGVSGPEQPPNAHPGSDDEAVAVASPVVTGSEHSPTSTSNVAAGAAVVGSVVEADGAAAVEEVSSVLGAGRISAGGHAPSPEAHPLQRLAASVKDAIRVSGRSVSASASAPEGERHRQQLAAPQPHQQQRHAQGDHLVASALGGATQVLAGSLLRPKAQQQQEPATTGRRKWGAFAIKFDIRAFLDSLFL